MLAEHHRFLNPLCLPSTLDIFPANRMILDALVRHLAELYGTVLDIGCGEMPYKSLILGSPSRAEKYIGLDLSDSKYDPDLNWDGETIPLNSESVDCALATEVFEHCPNPEVVMREAARVLKCGGVLYFSVPFLWPLHCVPHDEYRYTPFALERHLRSAGFGEVSIEALGGWDATLAQMIGLWVRRSGLPRWKRRVYSRLATPFVRHLCRNDTPPKVFGEQTMMTLLFGSATKISA